MQFNFELTPKQTEFINNKSKYLLNSGGVGSAKTIGLVLKTIKYLVTYPKIFMLVGAQTYPLLRDTTLREFISFCPVDIIEKYNKTEQHFWFKNGSEVIFRTAEDESTKRGYTFGAIALDELTGINYDTWKTLKTRLRQIGNYPLQMFACTNPADFNHWIYKEFIENPIVNSGVVYSTSFDNPYLPKEYLEDLKNFADRNPEYFERMVMGKWGALEGVIYNLPMMQRVDNMFEIKYYNEIWAGLDFGFTHPMGLVVVGYRDPEYYILDEIYKHKLSITELIENVKLKVMQWNIEIIYCDPSRPEIIEELVRNGLNAVSAITKDKFAQIMFIKGLIGGGILKVNKECTYTLREFDSYVWDKRSVKEIPLKINDDCMDAMQYAICSRKMNIDGEYFEEIGEREFS